MVDRTTVEARAARLERDLEALARVERSGREAFVSDDVLRLQGERALQLAIQACIDVGAHLVAAWGLGPAEDYGDVFERLARGGGLERSLADRLKRAAGQRNLLVHAYLDLRPELVWEGIEAADDLREFMSWATGRAAASES